MHPSPDILALLALGEIAGTPAERDHVDSCPECRTEVAELARAVAAGRSSSADDGMLISPPDRVWQAIRGELGLGSAGAPVEPADISPEDATAPRLLRPEPVEGPSTGSGRMSNGSTRGDRPARAGRGRRIAALALAAALALVAGIGLGLGVDRVLGPRQTVLWTADLQALPSHSGSSGEAVVEEDADGNKTLVVKLNSPPPVDGSQEVWLIDRGVTKMQSLGHLTPSSNRFNIPADLDPRQFPVVDVSQEPPDGEPRHSGDSIVRGTLNV